MSKRIEDVYLLDMLAYAKKVHSLAAGLTRQAFDDDEEHQAAICHWLQTIGEAARRLPDEFQRAHPAIAWKDVIGMRNVIVHRYTSVNLEKIWNAATNEVPALIEHLERLLERR